MIKSEISLLAYLTAILKRFKGQSHQNSVISTRTSSNLSSIRRDGVECVNANEKVKIKNLEILNAD